MRRLALLDNPVREYDWGSRTAIADLLGQPSPSPEPQAELWMGAHPAAGSRVLLEGRRIPLLELIGREPVELLGREVAERFQGRLPFLFKVLAAEQPLSIQAHPDALQAREGFERERAAGLAEGQGLYADASPKPEILCALTPFQALCGFRHPEEIRASLTALGARSLAARCTGDAEAALRGVLSGLFDLAPPARERLMAEAAAAARRGAAGDTVADWVWRLQDLHPGDPGVLAPAFLNHVELAPGEALFLPARELHSYLGGVGVELMGNSDNVLRGGLTRKPVDPQELLRVLRFEPRRPERLLPEPDAFGAELYPSPAREFQLSRLSLRGAPLEPSPVDRGVEILLCTEGEVLAEAEGSPERLTLRRGGSLLAPAAAGAYTLTGRGTLYRASVPA